MIDGMTIRRFSSAMFVMFFFKVIHLTFHFQAT